MIYFLKFWFFNLGISWFEYQTGPTKDFEHSIRQLIPDSWGYDPWCEPRPQGPSVLKLRPMFTLKKKRRTDDQTINWQCEIAINWVSLKIFILIYGHFDGNMIVWCRCFFSKNPKTFNKINHKTLGVPHWRLASNWRYVTVFGIWRWFGGHLALPVKALPHQKCMVVMKLMILILDMTN